MRRISIRQRKYVENGSMTKFKKKSREYHPAKDLLNEKLIASAVWECLKDNDPNGVIEILEAHLRTKNKCKLAREKNLPRTTFYHAFKSKNPTLQTLAKLVHATT